MTAAGATLTRPPAAPYSTRPQRELERSEREHEQQRERWGGEPLATRLYDGRLVQERWPGNGVR